LGLDKPRPGQWTISSIQLPPLKAGAMRLLTRNVMCWVANCCRSARSAGVARTRSPTQLGKTTNRREGSGLSPPEPATGPLLPLGEDDSAMEAHCRPTCRITQSCANRNRTRSSACSCCSREMNRDRLLRGLERLRIQARTLPHRLRRPIHAPADFPDQIRDPANLRRQRGR
jgi:hypothetical protein